MNLLAIDTTEDACSAALWIDGDSVERFEVAPRRHSELILPMMDGLLAESGMTLAQIDVLAFARGPGAFTGLRIATAIVQGAAFGAAVPVVPVSSLQALAQGVRREHAADAVLSALDARMGEVYWGAYRADANGLMRPALDEAVCAPAEVEVPDGEGWRGGGSGWQTYGEALAARCPATGAVYPGQWVHARDVATLAAVLYDEGGAVDAAQALPVYLRNDVAWAKS